MKIPEIDMVGPKPLQRAVDGLAHVFWRPPDDGSRSRIVALNKSELRSKEKLVTLSSASKPTAST